MARRSDHTREELRDLSIKAASDIVVSDGLRNLSIRKIAGKMGYTSGTLYQVFRNLDALIVEVHIATLKDLQSALLDLDLGGDPRQDLLDLAQGYTAFGKANANRWSALFEHSLPEGEQLPEEYDRLIFELVGMAAKVIEPILGPGEEVRAHHEAQVLWACLYGIVSLASSGNLSRRETTDSYVHSLVENYLAGLKVRSG